MQTDAARRLYHQYAADQPILDYHCHLPPRDIAEDRRFDNLFAIWLEGDHYKWRAMRANGVDERLITGDADPYDKFLAWARTVPQTLRNPLYHWTHLELKRYFEIDELLDERSAERIWRQAGQLLEQPHLTAQGILKKFQVTAVCTTDDPADDLAYHQQLAESDLPTRVYPTFRPDKALAVDTPQVFNEWLDRLGLASNMEIRSLANLLDALTKRHLFFHDLGGRLSDHGLPYCYADFCDERQAAAVFERARGGQAAGPDEHRQFASFMMLFFGRLDAERGWTKQLHLGALRNTNRRLFQLLGPDIGCDSVGDFPQAAALAKFLARLDQEAALPRMILYNNNPRDNFVFATMIGNFQDGSIAGKLQFGSGWWHLDQREGMEWQLNALSNLSLLARFVGMLTDSRSLMSFPRHEYFRRTLCNLLGRDMANGELPNDDQLVGSMVRNICYHNARQYLGLDVC